MYDMSPGKHIDKIVGETYNVLQIIRVAFSYIGEDMMKIIITLIHLRLECAGVAWSLNVKKDI